MNTKTLYLLFTCFASVASFSANLPRPASQLSEIDEACIENVAEFCTSAGSQVDECDLEEYEALMNQLQTQRGILAEHVDYIDGLIAKLQAGPEQSDQSSTGYIAG